MLSRFFSAALHCLKLSVEIKQSLAGALLGDDFPGPGHVTIRPLLYNCLSLIASHCCLQLSVSVPFVLPNLPFLFLCCSTGRRAGCWRAGLAANPDVVFTGAAWDASASSSAEHITDPGLLLPLPAMVLMLL